MASWLFDQFRTKGTHTHASVVSFFALRTLENEPLLIKCVFSTPLFSVIDCTAYPILFFFVSQRSNRVRGARTSCCLENRCAGGFFCWCPNGCTSDRRAGCIGAIPVFFKKTSSINLQRTVIFVWSNV